MPNTDPSLPDSDPATPVPDSGSGADAAEQSPLSALPADHRYVVERLTRRVERAAETIRRLRAENERLRRRVEELEAGPDVPEDETLLTIDDDPEALRERITQFIDAIDDYLERSSSASPDAPEDPPDA